jgi:phospho-N-acetylmuramoyl-pentapeptide-transferase
MANFTSMDLIMSIAAISVGFVAGMVLTWLLLPVLRKLHAGQSIRDEAPISHQVKSGTPTMGGIAIIITTVWVSMIGISPTFGFAAQRLLLVIAAFVLFGIVGFADDYLKVVKKRNLGLSAKQKLFLQIVISVGFALHPLSGDSEIWIPGVDIFVDFGAIFYIPFVVFVMVAMANSVNLTDGLDGLATGVTAIIALFFAAVGLVSGSGFITFFLALTGACFGFLILNKNPAKVFMGDTGSLALGGGLAAAALVMGRELLLPIVGFVYVAESLSVIIQVISFKTTGKRVFKMSPLHHHFELSGMSEKNVVRMFWGVTAALCLFGFFLV